MTAPPPPVPGSSAWPDAPPGSAPGSASGSPSGSARTGKRWYAVAVGILLIMLLGYADRVNVSVAAPQLMKAFHLSASAYGVVSSSFGWLYTLVLVPVGVLIDRRGARRYLPAFIVIWSIGAGLTGAAAGLGMLLVARLVLGLGESAVVPGSNIVVREWSPARERGLFTGFSNAGTLIGPGLGSIVAAALIASAGWRGSFGVMTLVGLIVAVAWWALYRPPEEARWLTKAERRHIQATRLNADTAASARGIPVARLFRTRAVWGLMLTQGCANYTSYLFLTFLPLYLSGERHISGMGTGWISGVTYGGAAIGTLAISILSDRFLKPARLKAGGRRYAISIAMICGMVLLAAPAVTSTAALVILVAIVLALITAALSLNYTLASDLTADSSSTGRVVSFNAFGGNVFGLLAPIVTGWLIDRTGSYTVPFEVAAVLLGVGALINLFVSRGVIEA
jgi:ACS family glucarate transporter-like MFS transporter